MLFVNFIGNVSKNILKSIQYQSITHNCALNGTQMQNSPGKGKILSTNNGIFAHNLSIIHCIKRINIYTLFELIVDFKDR